MTVKLSTPTCRDLRRSSSASAMLAPLLMRGIDESVPAEPTDFFYGLRSRHNIVGRFIRHPGMNYDLHRFSTHIFNTPDEIDLAVGLVRENAQ